MKTQIRKPARERTSYTKEYKEEALELWRASGRSAAKVARSWGYAHRCSTVGHAPNECPTRLALDVKRGAAWKNWRRRSNVYAKLLEQREVLKKSLGILSEVPPRGMPGSTR